MMAMIYDDADCRTVRRRIDLSFNEIRYGKLLKYAVYMKYSHGENFC